MTAWSGMTTNAEHSFPWSERGERAAAVERPPLDPAPGQTPPLDRSPLPAEADFYGRYRWCLDAFPTVGDARRTLLRELWRVGESPESWQRDEVITNVFLLSAALCDSVDDYLAGEPYDFSAAAAVLPGVGGVTTAVDRVLEVGRGVRAWRLGPLRRWRVQWGEALHTFLQAWLAAGRDAAALAPATSALALAAGGRLPDRLLARRVRVPAAFRTQDLTHHDILELSARFAADCGDLTRPVLVVGLRTAGSFFAPLVRASLAARGFTDVEAVTLRPKKRVVPWEQAALARCAARKGLSVIVDEPADTGTTLARVVDALRRAGVPPADTVALLPVHPSRRNWQDGYESLPVSHVRVLTLAPEDRHKHRLLQDDLVERRLKAYFRARGYSRAAVLAAPAAEPFNRRLQDLSDEKFHTRLKRVYAVRLERGDGGVETRFVLAKSVGWGWLSYHAFLAAEALSGFVPPLLGLRDGILYTEWLPQPKVFVAGARDREPLLRQLASYVAARVATLRLDDDLVPALDVHHQKGAEMLATALSGAYGWKPAAVLKRVRIRHDLTHRRCPVPTLIDGKMRPQEWVRSGASFLKTDFEHHGMGKTELNVTDPAYDLADAILHFGLSSAEEEILLQRYRALSGDHGVEERLFLSKLLAGTASRIAALDNLADPRLRRRGEEFNRRYIDAWDFLTRQTVRFCSRLCPPPRARAWTSPLVVLDIDGVLDKQIFGYPSTTAAGLEALSLLHSHGIALAFNTARTLAEIKDYCQAYGGVGGVGEYGSVAWDAVADRTRVLVTPESHEELRRLGEALQKIPGMFLNANYQHSLRAYTYDRHRTLPVPAALVEGLIAELGLQRVRIHQTYLDTTVLAAEVDKGRGLLALLDLAGRPDLDTMAVGDSEPDLAMFRVASRSFAPRHISGRTVARMLGCRIADRSYQSGLLAAVRLMAHPKGERCSRCACAPAGEGLFWEVMRAADDTPVAALLNALRDPMALQAFVR